MLTMVTCNCNQSDLYAKTNVKASPANINNEMKTMLSKRMSKKTNTNVKYQNIPGELSLLSCSIAFFLFSANWLLSLNHLRDIWCNFGLLTNRHTCQCLVFSCV